MASILIIDDDNVLRHGIAENLLRAGHTVLQAADGLEGIDLFHSTPVVDLVLTDLVMPNKEGLETINELHREKPGLPIIAMSGGMMRSPTYLKIAAAFGARHVLAKPFTRQELLTAIEQALAASPPKPSA